MRCVPFVLLAVMAVCYLIIQHMKHTPGYGRSPKIAVKCAATLMAVFTALLGCLHAPAPGRFLILAGLCAGTAADGVLIVHFVAGGALFALGHILYILAFCLMGGVSWGSLWVFLGLMGLFSLGLARFRRRMGRRAPLFAAYAAVLMAMVSLAAFQHPLFAAGAALFAFSDALLFYLLMERDHVRLDYISLGAYYLGQFLLALGTWAA